MPQYIREQLEPDDDDINFDDAIKFLEDLFDDDGAHLAGHTT